MLGSIMKKIALEDIATVFASEFVKECRHKLIPENASCCCGDTWGFTPFLKMSYARRRKLVEKVLDKLSNKHA